MILDRGNFEPVLKLQELEVGRNHEIISTKINNTMYENKIIAELRDYKVVWHFLYCKHFVSMHLS